MNNPNGKLPAFPTPTHTPYLGLTKREWLSGMVLSGKLASKSDIDLGMTTQQLVIATLEIVDALLAELDKHS